MQCQHTPKVERRHNTEQSTEVLRLYYFQKKTFKRLLNFHGMGMGKTQCSSKICGFIEGVFLGSIIIYNYYIQYYYTLLYIRAPLLYTLIICYTLLYIIIHYALGLLFNIYTYIIIHYYIFGLLYYLHLLYIIHYCILLYIIMYQGSFEIYTLIIYCYSSLLYIWAPLLFYNLFHPILQIQILKLILKLSS